MALTFVSIATVTVGSGGAASIDFQNIPATYTDLSLFVSGRTERANVWDGATIKFNNSSSDFTYRALEGGDSAAASFNGTSSYFNMSGANATASTFSNGWMYIPNYSGSNNKSFSIDTVNESNQSGSCYQTFFAGLWSQTTAIDRITLTPTTGPNFVQYSTATLYGIENTV